MINGELIVDNFAGGGGASTGIELATGKSVDIAINHDPEAIRMHKANHPNTKHYCEDVWQELKEVIQEIKNSTMPIPTQQKLIDELEGSRWIPIDERQPETDTYILVSFENCNMPDIARYEEDKNGGAFYPGDEEKSYISYGLIVNAWKPLPVTYREVSA